MDLENYKIKFGEVMKNKEAATLLKNSFPEWANSPLLRMASKMSLGDVMKLAKKHVPQEKIEAVIQQLEQL